MYYKVLPDHSAPGFDEKAHFDRFRTHNMVFHAAASKSFCEEHVGCLSVKTVRSGEEWYTVNGRPLAVRPGQLLILNDDQPYSSKIETAEKVQTLSVFFRKSFAAAVFDDARRTEAQLLDTPLPTDEMPLFYQTLHAIDRLLQRRLDALIRSLEIWGYDKDRADEQLVFLLHHLLRLHCLDQRRAAKVQGIKPGTRQEIYRRLCTAKDIMHASFNNKLGLETLGRSACLSTPQLIRQFRSVFGVTPHQYLTRIRLEHAGSLLKTSTLPVAAITPLCGFEDASAFGRLFRKYYGWSPDQFRKHSK